MPIYAYRCEACGFAKDILQKISDAPLTDCEACGKSAMKKQLTAAGFQLKGSGWYVTDFRNNGNNGGAAKPKTDAGDSSGGGEAASDTAAAAPSNAASAPAADTPSASPAAT